MMITDAIIQALCSGLGAGFGSYFGSRMAQRTEGHIKNIFGGKKNGIQERTSKL
jgi:hypothetical protein